MYLTGKPYTSITGAYPVIGVENYERYFPIYSAKNGNRLPDYHRLDLAINWNYGKPGKLNGLIGLSLFNAYCSKNIWYKSFQVLSGYRYQLLETEVRYLGIMPNLNITCNLL